MAGLGACILHPIFTLHLNVTAPGCGLGAAGALDRRRPRGLLGALDERALGWSQRVCPPACLRGLPASARPCAALRGQRAGLAARPRVMRRLSAQSQSLCFRTASTMRFQWHVEDGLGAFLQPNGMGCNRATGVTHASMQMEARGGGAVCGDGCVQLAACAGAAGAEATPRSRAMRPPPPTRLSRPCMQLSGQALTLEALLSLPPNYLREGSVSCSPAGRARPAPSCAASCARACAQPLR